jgi:hypothetical protein
MQNLTIVARPVTVGDMSLAFGMKPSSLETILRRHRIGPACRIGRVRCYGRTQVKRIAAALGCAQRP